MKRKKVFGKNITFLIIGVLVVLAFIRGDKQTWFLGGVFAIFIIWTICSVLGITLKNIKESVNKRKTRKPNDTKNEDDNDTVLLRHVNCRISEYLKSVYPAITWEWQSENPEYLAVNGGTGRIRLYGITDFNYADVTFDEHSQLNCEMIKIVPFVDLRKNGGTEPEKKQNKPSSADPEAWYSIQGKKILESCIADL
ncbi:MAG: hypothetical protein FWD71_20940, partial [Oscillospiraceae bacterium]|nr:hypothetical protein [Oscillospiraceae bacterium]